MAARRRAGATQADPHAHPARRGDPGRHQATLTARRPPGGHRTTQVGGVSHAMGKLASFATVSPYPPEQPSLFLSANRHRIGRTTMITTVPRTPTLGSPRRPALDRPAAMTLAETAYQRFLAQLRDLPDDDWSRPTACPDWDVRAVASHVLAQAEMAASVRQGVRQARAARG